MKRVLTGTIFSLFLLIAGCATAQEQSLAYDDFIKKANDVNGIIVDARTPQEYQSGHLKNAVLINFLSPDFTKEISKLDKDGHYFLYCRTGNRTGKALQVMKENGFKNVYHLKGGIVSLSNPDVLIKEN